MKSYLDLIRISAKVRRKQTRMIRLCIVLSVLLIAAIFGMADMYLRSMRIQTELSDGAWHVGFKALDAEQTAIIRARPEIKTSARYAVTNYHLDREYRVGGELCGICGFDEDFLKLYPGEKLAGGAFPQEADEALVTESMRARLGLKVGEEFTLETPDGNLTFRVSGFVEDTALLLKSGAYCIFLNIEGYRLQFSKITENADLVLFVQFVPYCNIQKTVGDICTQLGIAREQVGENTKLLALMLQSRDTYVLSLYFTATVLALLVAVAAILMILGSLNTSVAQRTEFFGRLRCLGATGRQVRRFVRREALSWCRAALPVGLALSVAVVWALCAALKKVSPQYFGTMPVFGVSVAGLAAGAAIGVLTVLAAAKAPAKRAASVSPLAAVSSGAGTLVPVRRAANMRHLPVTTALGIHHALGGRRNALLLTGSFAFSIVLFLSFSTTIDFMQHAITPLRPYTPDVSLISRDKGCDLPHDLLSTLSRQNGVKRAFGRSFQYELPCLVGGEACRADLVSYERFQFGWAEGDLTDGSIEQAERGDGVLLVDETGRARAGEEITISTALNERTVKIAGVLSASPFSTYAGNETRTIICSEALFYDLTGETGYTVIDIQLDDPSDAVAENLRTLAGDAFVFSDSRKSNSEVRGVYYAFSLFVYGFLTVIALISVFNVINSIAMSASARMRQYGAMRAIGTSVGQLAAMIAAETGAYLACGLLAGLAIGTPLHYLLYSKMISSRWGDVWHVPVLAFAVIAGVMLLSAFFAAAGPVRRIQKMSITETINCQ